MNTYYQVWKGKKGEWEVRTIKAKDRNQVLSITEIEMFITNKYPEYSFDFIYDVHPRELETKEKDSNSRFGKDDKFLNKEIPLPTDDEWLEYHRRIKNRKLKN